MADTKHQGPVDAGKALQAAAVTKTASFDGAALDLGAGFAPGGGGQSMDAAVPVTALDFTTTDETYSFKMQESDDDSTYTDCSPAVSALTANVGSSILLPGRVQKRYVRYSLTIAGTSPSITYGPIFLVPHR
jgi:hypothetical protein